MRSGLILGLPFRAPCELKAQVQSLLLCRAIFSAPCAEGCLCPSELARGLGPRHTYRVICLSRAAAFLPCRPQLRARRGQGHHLTLYCIQHNEPGVLEPECPCLIPELLLPNRSERGQHFTEATRPKPRPAWPRPALFYISLSRGCWNLGRQFDLHRKHRGE